MRTVGWIIVCVGVAVGVYSMVFFDPSVGSGDYSRVVNIERLDYRRNLLIVSGIAVIGGLLLAVLSPRPKEHPFLEAMLVNDLFTMENMLKTGAAEVDGRSSHGWTWLREAVERCDVPQTSLLLRYGADPDRPTNERYPSSREFVSDRAKYGPRKFKELHALLESYPASTPGTNPADSAQG